jgi:hypothetical protein
MWIAMTVDEDRVRTLLQTAGVPRSRLDAGELLADGRHSQRRRRLTTVAGAVLAVVAVAVPAAVVLANRTPPPDPPDRPSPVATDISMTPRVEHRRTSLGATVKCTPTAFEVPRGTDFDGALVADPTGRRVVTTTRSHVTTYIWTDGRPSDFNGMNQAVPKAVTTDGVVYGVHIGPPMRSFTYRATEYRPLPPPAGYEHASVVAINGHGDAVGQIFPEGARSERSALVVWSADRRDQPRVIIGPDLTAVGILDDGTVLAAKTGSVNTGPLQSDALVVIRPDDTRVEIDLTGDLDGISPRIKGTAVHGDFLFALYSTTGWPNIHPVRWNLRTGRVEIFDDLFGLKAGNAAGWISATDRAGGDAPAVLIAPDGTARRLSADQHVTWIGPTGTELIGRIGWDGAPLTWRCD